MEEIRDSELGIVGERYRSFLEFYRVNDVRPLNALYAEAGDMSAEGIFEIADGVMCSPEDTREALLYGSGLFHERFERAGTKARNLLRDKYEWLDVERFESDAHGQNVIVERHVLGHPKSFSRRRANTMRKRSVRILYDEMCPASTPLDARINAGCAVLAAVGALEQIGYEVALSFVLAKYSGTNAKGDATLLLDIPLKGFGERVLPAKTEFALASKSMLFHVGSWWTHRFPRTPVFYGAGEGYPISYDKGRLQDMRAYAERHHGVYVSEDIVEVQLESNPVRVLEHVITGMGEDRELVAHLRGETPLAAGVQPEQGKMFPGMRPMELAREGDGLQDGAGERVDGGLQDGEGADDAAAAPEGGEMMRDGGPQKGDEPGKGAQDDGVKAKGRHLGAGDGHADAPEGQGRQEEGGQKGEAREDEGSRLGGSAGAKGSKRGDGGEDAEALEGQAGQEEGGARGEGDRAREDDADAQGDEGFGDEAEGAKTSRDDAGGGAGGNSDGSCETDVTSENDDHDSSEDDDGDTDDADGIEENGKGAAMSDKEDENGVDFAQITKALEDEMAGADPAMPQSAEDFVVMLRRRYVLFEQGEYLDMMISQKMARRKAEKKRHAADSPLAPPPAPADAPTLDNVKFGAPRNTPFSMTSIPQRKS